MPSTSVPSFAMAAPPEGGSPWLQLVPFALVLGHLLLHHPAADEAQAAEGAGVSRRPEGRRPGHHDRRHLRADHAPRRPDACSSRSPTRCASKCRGRPSAATRARSRSSNRDGRDATASGRTIMSNLRWKLITDRRSSSWCSRRVGVYPIVAARYGVHSPGWLMDKQLKLGLDLKGGVHLVLRVQTDDALRLETDRRWSGCARSWRSASITVTNLTSPDPDAVPRRGRAAGAGRRVPPGRRPRCRRTSTASSGAQRHLHVHDEAEHPA